MNIKNLISLINSLNIDLIECEEVLNVSKNDYGNAKIYFFNKREETRKILMTVLNGVIMESLLDKFINNELNKL